MKIESPRAHLFDACLDIALEVGLDKFRFDSKGCGFEFGDDPAYVKSQILLVELLLERYKVLVSSVNIARDGLARANNFFALSSELNELKTWLNAIEESEHGNRENFRELKKKIEKVMAANIKVWRVLSENQVTNG